MFAFFTLYMVIKNVKSGVLASANGVGFDVKVVLSIVAKIHFYKVVRRNFA